MIKSKLFMLAVGILCNFSIVCAQPKFCSAAPNSSETPVYKIAEDIGDGKVLYGYCSPDMSITKGNGAGYPTDSNVEITAAIRLSQGITHLLEGRKIYELRVGAAASVKSATLFIRNASGETLWEKVVALETGWNNFALDAPLAIPETKELYIGYSFTQKNRVFAVATTTSGYRVNGMFIAADDMPLQEISEVGNLCLLAELEATPEEFKYVASVTSAYAPAPYKVKGESGEVEVNIFNEGEEKISRAVFGRSFNGVELEDFPCIFKRALQPGTYGNITFEVTPEESGKYTYSLKEIEGEPVSGLASASAEFSLYNKEAAFQRMVVIEEFTSQTCGNCPAGQTKLHNTISGNEDRVAMVLHHAGYQADAFTIEESEAYCYFYNAGGATYAPAMMMDRTYISDYTSGAVTPVYHPNYLVKSRFLQELELPAMVSVDIKSSYDEATRKLSVTVSGRKITDLIGDRVGLTVFLLESNFIDSQSGGGSKFEHNNFPRYVFTDVKGDVLTFNEDGIYSKEYTYTIPESYTAYETGKVRDAHPENMSIVAFVANFDTVRPDNCVILNGNKTTSLNETTVSDIQSVAAESPFNLYVKEGTVHVEGEYESCDIYNLQGMAVENGKLTKGIYLVKIRDANKKEYRKKVLVQ